MTLPFRGVLEEMENEDLNRHLLRLIRLRDDGEDSETWGEVAVRWGLTEDAVNQRVHARASRMRKHFKGEHHGSK